MTWNGESKRLRAKEYYRKNSPELVRQYRKANEKESNAMARGRKLRKRGKSKTNPRGINMPTLAELLHTGMVRFGNDFRDNDDFVDTARYGIANSEAIEGIRQMEDHFFQRIKAAEKEKPPVSQVVDIEKPRKIKL